MPWPAELRPLERLASVAQIGGFRPPSTPRTSWAGQVLLGAPGETWPQSNGRPMWGVAQIRLDELPAAPPEPLRDIALVTLFLDLLEPPFDTPNGERWELRTYDTVDDLVPLLEPEREPVPERRAHEDITLRPFPVQWHPRVEIPSHDTLAEAGDERAGLYDEHEELFDVPRDGLKVGGWPDTVQSEVIWSVDDAEFVMQLDRDEKTGLDFADGAAYVGFSPTSGWQISIQMM